MLHFRKQGFSISFLAPGAVQTNGLSVCDWRCVGFLLLSWCQELILPSWSQDSQHKRSIPMISLETDTSVCPLMTPPLLGLFSPSTCSPHLPTWSENLFSPSTCSPHLPTWSHSSGAGGASSLRSDDSWLRSAYISNPEDTPRTPSLDWTSMDVVDSAEALKPFHPTTQPPAQEQIYLRLVWRASVIVLWAITIKIFMDVTLLRAFRALGDERPQNFRQVSLFLFVLFTVVTSRLGLVVFHFETIFNKGCTPIDVVVFCTHDDYRNNAMLQRYTEGTPCYSCLSAIECSAVTKNIFVKSIHPHTSRDSVVSHILCLHLLILVVQNTSVDVLHIF